MNLHPGRKPPIHDWKFTVEQNLRTLHDLIPTAQDRGVGLMIENIPGEFNSVRELAELLEPLPELGLHLDIGHSNLMVERNTADDILAKYGKRLRHVHLHDNKGGSADLHLPLGTGLVDTAHYVRALQSIGYDGTITLEVFTPDRRYLEYSRDTLRRLWDEAARQQEPEITAPPVAARAN
jgi:sugar phosphate isomerase/epimerase